MEGSARFQEGSGRFALRERAAVARQDRLEMLAQAVGSSAERRLEAMESLLTVRSKSGRSVALRANRAQRMFERCAGRENVVLKARQMGMTTWAAARFFLQGVVTPGTATLHVSHTQEAAEAIVATVRRMWDGLPVELRDGPMRLRRSHARGLTLANGSEVLTASAADANAGRGLSVQRLHCSEVARWGGDARATLAGLRAALAPGGECVLESTPQGAYGAFYEEWTSADAGVVRHFFPWWMEEAYAGAAVAAEAMTLEELRLVADEGLSAEQIGFRRGLERTYGSLRAQEFAEDAVSCFRATGSCCFEVAAVERRLAEAPEPMARRKNGALWVWLPAMAGRRYLVAVDTAGGGAEGDFAAAQVVDMPTGMQCAELQARLRPVELVEVVKDLAAEYGGATVVVERNNHGAAVLALLEGTDVRLWRDGRGEAGWLTTASSKPGMVAALGRLLLERPEAVMSRRLLAECRTFVRAEGGKLGATAGSHDDLVMAMALGERIRMERTVIQ